MPHYLKYNMKKTPQVVDTEEIFDEELPAALVAKLRDWHAHLVALVVQYEYAPRSWKQVRRQVTFGDPPPAQGPEALAKMVMDIIRESVAKWPGSSTPPEKYRVRAQLRRANGDSAWRTHPLRPDFDATGELEIVDADADDATEKGALHVMAAQLDAAYQQSLKCLEAVTASCTNVIAIGDAVQKMALGAAELAQRSAQGLAEVVRAENEGRQAQRDHEADLASQREWFDLLREVAGPWSQVLAAKHVGSTSQGNFARRLCAIRTKAGPGWDRLCEALELDERRMLHELCDASTDDAFLAIFQKLQTVWTTDRLGAVLPLVERHLGDAAQDLAALVYECSARAGL